MSNTEKSNTEKKTVYQKLMNVQHKLKAPKNQWNKFGKYPYRNAEDILEALKPLLYEEEAIVTLEDEIVQKGERYYIYATAIFTDVETGNEIRKTAVAREEENKKGMDASQVTGSTSSYARKYRLNGLFAIDDTKDRDVLNTHDKGKEEFTKAKPIPENTNAKAPIDDYIINQAQLKRLYAIAANRGIKSDVVKEQVQKRFGKEPKQLTKAEYDRVCNGYENSK